MLNNLTTPVIVSIRLNETGETRQYRTSLMNDGDHPNAYMWEEGNYSCDCNRELFFEEAGDDESESDEEPKCGNTRYSVSIATTDGKIVYDEFDDKNKPELKTGTPALQTQWIYPDVGILRLLDLYSH